jgi:hypothetical protein
MDLAFGTLIGVVLLFTVGWDLAFLGIIIGLFLLALAYVAGCESLRKGEKSE